ncbi:Tumor necrosis factor receptor superfamily member 6 [Merluccius polli]|uniref:Tumor necrosis factor receptor superfamily member 6 n=1 Tax=Merluccius polli TaxID=89951 RepID=A0AA47N5S5_MERPO|nr:Tumor necrosis factor receptor superfamily member 6 [Merluccius polli]
MNRIHKLRSDVHNFNIIASKLWKCNLKADLTAGSQRLSQPCGNTPEDRVCEYCDPGKTYSSVPNAQSTCKPCTSCTEPWANLEVKEECTITKNAVCQCIEDHYCSSTLCTTCNPCDKRDSHDSRVLEEEVFVLQ